MHVRLDTEGWHTVRLALSSLLDSVVLLSASLAVVQDMAGELFPVESPVWGQGCEPTTVL